MYPMSGWCLFQKHWHFSILYDFHILCVIVCLPSLYSIKKQLYEIQRNVMLLLLFPFVESNSNGTDQYWSNRNFLCTYPMYIMYFIHATFSFFLQNWNYFSRLFYFSFSSFVRYFLFSCFFAVEKEIYWWCTMHKSQYVFKWLIFHWVLHE